jgi:Zn ribbon nucleic-acid-binding protein
MEAIQIVECLKCSYNYFEKDKRVDTCSNCGNDNPQETIFLSPEGEMYWDVLKDLNKKEFA